MPKFRVQMMSEITRYGFTEVEAETAEEATALVDERLDNFDLTVLDVLWDDPDMGWSLERSGEAEPVDDDDHT